MPDNRKITIEILSSTNDKQQIENDAEQQMEQSIGNTMKTKVGGSSQSVKAAVLVRAFEQVAQLVIQAAEQTIERNYTLSEDYIGKANLNNIKTAIGKATGLVGSAGSGAIAGASFGPVGAVVGAVVGAGVYVGSEYLNNRAALSSRYQVLNAANINVEFARKRSGLYDEGRGTEN